MKLSEGKRRFRINPIELLIFSVVSLVFLNSLYKLFYDWDRFQPQPLAGDITPIAVKQTNRSIASEESGFALWNLASCDTFENETPSRGKSHLKIAEGLMCGLDPDKPNEIPKAIEVIPMDENREKPIGDKATIFQNTLGKNFTTDLIRIDPNHDTNILIRFQYARKPALNYWLKVTAAKDID